MAAFPEETFVVGGVGCSASVCCTSSTEQFLRALELGSGEKQIFAPCFCNAFSQTSNSADVLALSLKSLLPPCVQPSLSSMCSSYFSVRELMYSTFSNGTALSPICMWLSCRRTSFGRKKTGRLSCCTQRVPSNICLAELGVFTPDPGALLLQCSPPTSTCSSLLLLAAGRARPFSPENARGELRDLGPSEDDIPTFPLSVLKNVPPSAWLLEELSSALDAVLALSSRADAIVGNLLSEGSQPRFAVLEWNCLPSLLCELR
mmetsp:Transcript_18023/g.35153  ORF Transcript_18023/g.35153 Transcript_18023/m.35153 type:complete len:261 (+) Transcript_18023:516-1298(+)